MLKVFSLYMIKYYHKGDYIMKGFGIKCINFNKTVGHEIRNQTFRILFTVFIKVVLIRYSGLSWFTQSKEQVKFKFEQQCPSWIQNRNCHNTKIHSHLCHTCSLSLLTFI